MALSRARQVHAAAASLSLSPDPVSSTALRAPTYHMPPSLSRLGNPSAALRPLAQKRGPCSARPETFRLAAALARQRKDWWRRPFRGDVSAARPRALLLVSGIWYLVLILQSGWNPGTPSCVRYFRTAFLRSLPFNEAQSAVCRDPDAPRSSERLHLSRQR
ncbi:hypothetical protein DFH11DRAFT_1603914 [Phellopilus nigrolimitatus]|nr:hypothetical protein DFH11DRAFT_1603914 [Phellopilus nigrolimitatus]